MSWSLNLLGTSLLSRSLLLLVVLVCFEMRGCYLVVEYSVHFRLGHHLYWNRYLHLLLLCEAMRNRCTFLLVLATFADLFD